MRAIYLTTVVLFALLGGCIASSAEEHEVDDSESKADGVTKPLGTYTFAVIRTDDDSGGISLSLMSDRTFRREENVDPFAGLRVDRGTYRYTKSGSKRYVTLTYTEDGDWKERFEYKLVDEVLRLRTPGTTDWYSYERDTERCDMTEDCALQGLVDDDVRCSGSSCFVDPR